VFLTGLGVPAESQIPNFLEEGHPWRSAAAVHAPRDLAKRQTFLDHPDVVWSWYLWRWAVCQNGKPNAAHLAIARASGLIGSRFLLITETVDGLHRRTRTPLESTYEVHGYLGAMRCDRGCLGLSHVPRLEPHPLGVGELTNEEREALVCVRCGAPTRPHVLWLDETYDEANHRYESALRAATSASALIVVGSSATSTLSRQVCERIIERRVPLIVITQEWNTVAREAAGIPSGIHLRGAAAQLLPPLVEELSRAIGGRAQNAIGAIRDRSAAGVAETILQVGAEGGSMTLTGILDGQGSWRFRLGVDCSTFAAIAPDEFTADELKWDGGWLTDFEEALKELDRETPWARLHPLRIHPAFATRILDAVRVRLNDGGSDDRTRFAYEVWQEVSERRRGS
jgi:NAD-dependent deacetylase